MNEQHTGTSGQPRGAEAEPVRVGTTAPTPVTSPAGTTPPRPGGNEHDAGQQTYAAHGSGPGAPDGMAPAGGWGAPAGEPESPESGWGAPKAKPKNGSAAQSWTVKRGLAVAGAAAVLAAGAGAGVFALTSSSGASDGAAGVSGGGLAGLGGQGPAQGGPGAQGGFGGGMAPGQGGAGNFPPDGTAAVGGLSAAVHSEYVVLQGNEYINKAEQLGTVTEVSSGTVTVKSSDGFSRSYSLAPDVLVSSQQQRRQQAGNAASRLTVADIVVGGTVRIVSFKNGNDYAAASVIVTAASGSAAGTGTAS